MKIKLDFITNSSSTAFMIQNTSDKTLNLTDFAKENMQLLDDYLNEYDWNKVNPRYTSIRLLESAAMNNIEFKSGVEKYCIFGDEDGSVIGAVYDYMLRGGGKSKNFTWSFREYLR
jgi:hypothetical protein